MKITPEPTEEEVAAIMAAIEAATPRGGGAPTRDGGPRWRWSGRWWTRPVPQRRIRPW